MLDEKQKNGIIAEFFLSISEIINVILLILFIDNIYVILLLIWVDLFNNIKFYHSLDDIIKSLADRNMYICGNSILYFIRSVMYVYEFILIYDNIGEIYLFFIICLSVSKMIREYGYSRIYNYFKSNTVS